MLVRNYNLLDIKKYENDTGNNILDFFNNLKIDNVLDLISLGNGNCSKEKASELLDEYLEHEGDLVTAMIEIKELLIGTGDNNKEEIDNEDLIDITKYDSLTDLYINFCMQLASVGLSYSEFWNMTTKEMYKVFNSIAIKIQNDTNRELSNYHTLAAMVGGAVWGKLQKEPPKINIVSNKKEENIDGLDTEDMIMVAKLKSMVKNHNKELTKSMKGE